MVSNDTVTAPLSGPHSLRRRTPASVCDNPPSKPCRQKDDLAQPAFRDDFLQANLIGSVAYDYQSNGRVLLRCISYRLNGQIESPPRIQTSHRNIARNAGPVSRNPALRNDIGSNIRKRNRLVRISRGYPAARDLRLAQNQIGMFAVAEETPVPFRHPHNETTQLFDQARTSVVKLEYSAGTVSNPPTGPQTKKRVRP